jgi:hypothetical protein
MQANSEYKAKVIAQIEANDARLAGIPAAAEADLAPALRASLNQFGGVRVEVKP